MYVDARDSLVAMMKSLEGAVFVLVGVVEGGGSFVRMKENMLRLPPQWIRIGVVKPVDVLGLPI